MRRLLWLLCALPVPLVLGGCGTEGVTQPAELQAGRAPSIRPDYVDTVVPPNIAPLNFIIEEPGERYVVECRGRRGEALTVYSRTPAIRFPARRWRALLEANRAAEVSMSVRVRGADGRWQAFSPIANRIADEPIDRYLTYRLIKPLYNYWRDVGIYQRDLQTFEERTILRGETLSDACVNCHSFCGGKTGRMTIGLRSAAVGSGTLLWDGRSVTALDAKWGYSSWHPDGGLVAVTLMQVRQFMHPSGAEIRDVVDLDSDLVIHHLSGSKVDTTRALADPDRLETYPAWSPDGKSLYYCSAAFPFKDRHQMPPENYEQVHYDLRRIPYDERTNTWGEPQTVVPAASQGLSALLPRVSPDGRFVAFCMCEYGCFPIFQPSSDLYLLDVRTGRYSRLPVSSDRSESWHSWSQSSRWLAFSSKRRDGLFTRTFLSHIDSSGLASKPFILPQEDPGFYDTFLKTYTVPELLTEPVSVSARALAAAARSSARVRLEMPETSMTPRERPGSPTPSGTDAWRPAPRG